MQFATANQEYKAKTLCATPMLVGELE